MYTAPLELSVTKTCPRRSSTKTERGVLPTVTVLIGALGGCHDLTTAPGQGTAIHVWAPLAALAHDFRVVAPSALAGDRNGNGDKEEDT